MDLCIKERQHDVLPELMRLRDRAGVTFDQLSRIREFFFNLSNRYMRLEDECFGY